MKTICKLICITIAVAIFPAASRAASVTVEAGTARGAAGSKVAVPINIHNAQKLGSLQLDLGYDPALLEAKDDAVEKGSFSQPITIISHVLAPGSLRIVMYGSASEAIDGDGTLLKAIFTVKGQNGQSCDLKLDGVKAGDNIKPDARSAPMLVTVQHGKFTVGSAFPLWMIIVAAVLLLLVLCLATRKKSKPQGMPLHGTPPPLPGTSPHPAGRFCSACGAAAAPGAKFCGSCGKPV